DTLSQFRYFQDGTHIPLAHYLINPQGTADHHNGVTNFIGGNGRNKIRHRTIRDIDKGFDQVVRLILGQDGFYIELPSIRSSHPGHHRLSENVITGDQMSIVFKKETAALGHRVAVSIQDIDYDG